MRASLSFKQLALDVWLIETFQFGPKEGFTLEELQALWREHGSEGEELNRMTLWRHRQYIRDRVLSLELLEETFTPNPAINPATYFDDAFGIWVDDRWPAQDVLIAVSPYVAHYFRTLPLHHSQRELKPRKDMPDRVIFRYHIIPSPEFLGELRRWGDQVQLLTETKAF